MDENDLDTAGAVTRYLAGRKPEAQTRASMALAVGTPAEQEAEYRRLALKAGVPLDTAKGATDEVKRAAALNAVDFGDLAQRFPSTSAYLANPDNAKIAHDDVDGMSLTEGLVNSFKRGLPSLKQNMAGLGMGYQQPRLQSLNAELEHRRSGGAPGRYAAGSEDDLRAQLAAIQANNTGAAERIVSAQGEKVGLPSDPVVQRVMDAKGFGDAIAAFSTDPVKFIANVGPESLVQSAPGIAAAIPLGVAAGPIAGAAAMGGGSFAVDYGATLLEALGKEGVNVGDPAALQAASKDQALMRRVMAQAVAHAGVVGAFDAISGGVASKVLLPGKVAAKLASRPLAREIANLGVQVPVQGALGGLGEAGGELAAGQEISPGNILAEIVGEAFTAPVEVAGIANKAIRERMRVAQDAKHDAQVLTDLSKAAEASKVKARDPQSFKAFIDAATENGPVQEVFVSPQSLAQSGVDIKALAEASPAVAEQIDAANAGGMDIRIPVSEFATAIAGTPMAEQLIPHLRTDADGMSMVEADEFIKTHGEALRADVEKILARRDTNDAARAGRDAVRDNFLRQIVATGRYTEESAKPVAAAAAAFYATQAARLGISAEALYQQYPLTVSAAGAVAPGFSQFAGVNAQGSDKHALAGAEQMLNAGRSAEVVRRETGWHIGVDGRWRFEITDDDAKFNAKGIVSPDSIADEVKAGARVIPDPQVPGLFKALYREGTPDYLATFGRTEEDAVAALARAVAKSRSQGAFDIAKVKPGEAVEMSTVLDHPRLFAAYPDLAQMRVSFVSGVDYRGAFFPEADRINIAISDSPEQMLSTLLHEVQHAIQHREGFATGGNSDSDFTRAVRTALDDLANRARQDVENWKWANKFKIDSHEQAATVARFGLMYESAQRLIEYANRDAPSGVFRLIRNEMQWIYDKDLNKVEAARELQRDFYSIPKPHRMRERNAFIGDMSFRAARVLLDQIPAEYREQFKSDPRTMRGMVKGLQRVAEKARDQLRPLNELEKSARAAGDVKDAHAYSSPFDIYRALAGEVEARNTQARQKLTDAERTASSPLMTADVPAEKVVVMFGGMDVQAPRVSADMSQSTGTPAFAKWFSDSKVVDAEGKPLVVFHGTPTAELKIFDANRIGTNGRAEGAGFYFTTDMKTADGYGQRGRTLDTYLSIRQPLAYDAKPFSQAQVRKLLTEVAKVEAEDTSSDWRDGFLSNYVDTYSKSMDAAVREAARAFEGEETALDQVSGIVGSGVDANTVNTGLTRALGYDGYFSKGFSGEGQGGGDIWVAMRSEQVKSASENSGAFNPADPNIFNQQDRGAFTPSTLNISLLETADLSTALHELGHAFLEITADIAARDGAPADVAADLKTLLDWFGIQAAEGKTQFDTWRDMTLDEQRESHEKFARGFEAYLFEGKAPSVELQGVFQRFRAWLLNVYQTLKSLNVTLTDDVRGVMDRMLASEQEIETAEAAQSMAALFQTPEQAAAFGLDWAKYQELGRAQTEQAISELETRSLKDMQWLSNARARVLKQLQKDAAEKRRDMRSRVRTEVMAEPVYRAWAFLTGKVAKPVEPTEAEADYRRDLKDYRQKRVEAEEQAGKDERARMLATQPDLKGLQKGQFLAKNKRQVDINVQQRMLEWDQANKEPEAPPAADGSVPPGEEVGKLDLAGVKASDKAAAETLQKRRMTGKDGIDPDVLAEQFGFTSGQQLIKALALADTPNEAVEGLTDQRMLETYGDISSPEALSRAVNEALFNEARQRAVATELKALEKAMQVRGEGKNADLQRSTVATLPAAAKQFALAMVAKLLVKDIKPNQYAASQARAARAAAKALGADDIATAAKEKRNELVNGYAFRAASDALAEVRDIIAFFRQIQKGNRETVAKTRDVNMVMAMRAIVAQYGVGIGPGERATDYLENVKAYDPATYEILRERVEAMSLAAQPYSEISMERLRGLADELKSMWTQSRRARQMEVDGQLVNREQAQAELMAELDGRVPDRIPGEGSAVTPREEFWAGLMSTLSHLVRVESWVSRMDGGDTGPFRKYVWQPIKEAADRYRADKAKHLQRYADLLKTIEIGKARIEAPELGYTFGESRGGSGKQEILHALLHTGNESNKRKLLLSGQLRSKDKATAWAIEREDGTLDTAPWDKFIKRMQDEGILGKAEYDFAQGVWDLLESMKPAAQKAHRDVFGAYFDEVTADGFVTPFGTYRGGYVPAMMDRRLDSTAAGRALADDENQTLAYAFPTTSKGFTKSRVEYNRPLLLDLRTLSSHIDKVTLFSNLEAPIRDVRKLLSGDVATAISRMDPAAINEMVNPWLQRAASQQVETNRGNETFAKFSAEARKRAGMAALFANLANAAQQVVGVFPASIKTSPKAMATAAIQYLTEPRKTAAMVAAASPYMATRMDNEIAQMNATMSDILLNPNVFQSGKAWLERHAYFVQSAVDNVVGPIVWTAAYNNAIQAGETEIEAARRADSVVRTTQGSTLPEDIARFEGGGTVSGHPFVRLFTQFAGYFNTQANFLGTEFVNTMRNMGLRKGIGRGIYIFTLGFLVPALVSEAIVQAFKGGPEDDDRDGQVWDDWLAALGIGTFKTGVAMVPVAGQLATATYNMGNDKPYDDRISTSPAISMIESSVRAPFSAYEAAVNGGNAQKAVRDVATLISMTVGVPANAIARPAVYAAGVGQGRIEPTSPADAVRGAVTGVASPESKR